MRGGLSVESQGRLRLPAGPRPSRPWTMTLAVVAGLCSWSALSRFSSRRARLLRSQPRRRPAPRRRSVSTSACERPSRRARFTLDGRTLDTNPFEADMGRDDAPHRLSIRADGFETRDIDARLSRDLSVDVALAADPVPVAAVPSAARRPWWSRVTVVQRPLARNALRMAPRRPKKPVPTTNRRG